MSRIQFPHREVPPPAPKPKRKRLRKVSKKRAKLLRRVGLVRAAMRAGACMICRQQQAVDVHEIASGFARERCLEVPLLQMGLCRECHEAIQGAPAAEQIAAKILYLIDLACEEHWVLRGRRTVDREDVIARLMFTNLPE